MLASFMKFNNSNVACNLHLIVVVMLNLKFSSGHMNFTEFGLDTDEFVGVFEDASVVFNTCFILSGNAYDGDAENDIFGHAGGVCDTGFEILFVHKNATHILL